MSTNVHERVVNAHQQSRVTPAVLIAAHRHGLARIATAPLARRAGKSESTVQKWCSGEPVSAETDRSICAAIGLESPSTDRP